MKPTKKKPKVELIRKRDQEKEKWPERGSAEYRQAADLGLHLLALLLVSWRRRSARLGLPADLSTKEDELTN